MDPPRVLVVEDDAAVRRGVIDALTFAGYVVSFAGDAPRALSLARDERFDVVLLDLVLPHGDGLDVLAEVRRFRPGQPIIVLTARGAEEDRVRGLRLGADDYVVKPFSYRELLARIEAVLRRSPERRAAEPSHLDLGAAQVDLLRAEVRFGDGSRVELSAREVELLEYLAGHPGRTISREELLQRVWGLDPRGLTTRAVDMHVARLREKLRDNGDEPRILLTVRGRGYMLAIPDAGAST